ncbi:MAG: FAD-dependent oxidoreductase [Acidobacteria bacterium]|nr:FAD-dependent oxidoreductase [Acidobacteriota bacterium]
MERDRPLKRGQSCPPFADRIPLPPDSGREPHGRKSLPRRSFLAAPALVGLLRKSDRPIAGAFIDDSHRIGHELRDRRPFATPRREIRIPVVIVGAGIAGLSAAWRLDKRGFRDFVVLEMNAEAGGNSRCGQNEVSAYPWAAHYIPVPNQRAALVRELMEELGALQNGRWNERFLCFSPQERLYIHGRWQEGIEPELAATMRDREQYRRFRDLIEEQRATGQFTIPAELGARPSPLDQISMAEWLGRHRLDSPYLNWYVDYACRDDYGALARDTSAWAGIHYFAAREHEEKGPLTWPEGNGWIVQQLMRKLGRYVRPRAAVRRIVQEGSRVRVLTASAAFVCDRVIFAAPLMIAPYLMDGAPAVRIEYSPWITANLTLDRLPEERGYPLAWDNVIYGSASLGYVVATHMSLASHTERSVWTWYAALARGTPSANRRLLLEKDWSYWKETILNDISRAHPDIRQCVSRIDVLRLGHAMARPFPGSVFDAARRKLASAAGRIVYAHSDLSGFSIFEEAQYRGVRAADSVLTAR